MLLSDAEMLPPDDCAIVVLLLDVTLNSWTISFP